jgi:hypothetical protein
LCQIVGSNFASCVINNADKINCFCKTLKHFCFGEK